MYETFFNLKTKPFELVPNPEFLFFSRPHKKALTYLDYGIKEKIGFILLTGEVGSGKTTLIRNLIQGLNHTVKLSKIFNTKVSSEQLLAMINEDFGLSVHGKDKIALLRELNDFLIEQYMNNSQSVLIIDEAQNLTPELLEEIRLLSNLETDRYKLLQIVLVGQPELRKVLSQPEMRQLRQRINISCHLYPLTRIETEEYIMHRLEIAGNRDAVKFEDGTMDLIYTYSRGIPRLINITCDFLFLSAFVDEKREISVDLVKEVIGEVETENRYWQDEAPEKHFSANKETLQEMLNRLSRIEEEFFRKNISDNEKAEIFERLAHTEHVLDKFVSAIKNDIVDMQDEIAIVKTGIDSTRHEITVLNDTISSLEGERAAFKDQSNSQPVLYELASPKKGLLRSLLRTKNKNSGNH